MIDVIDYGGGNIGSMVRCLRRLGAPHRTVDKGTELNGNPVVLPGVGSFGAVMKALEKRGFTDALMRQFESDVPYLGICVGLQILFENSEESPDEPGLGALKGSVTRYKAPKVPQIGWNKISPGPASENDPSGYAYFVNSYFPEPLDEQTVLYHADYYGDFCAGIKSGSLTAFQFHPEKSGPFGHELVRRWIDAL